MPTCMSDEVHQATQVKKNTVQLHDPQPLAPRYPYLAQGKAEV